jgi:hypothetical protein
VDQSKRATRSVLSDATVSPILLPSHFGKACLIERLKMEDQERMLKWFEFKHLPDHLRAVSFPFAELALKICELCEPGPERTVSLRKLLEAKDAAVRAKVNPGG